MKIGQSRWAKVPLRHRIFRLERHVVTTNGLGADTTFALGAEFTDRDGARWIVTRHWYGNLGVHVWARRAGS